MSEAEQIPEPAAEVAQPVLVKGRPVGPLLRSRLTGADHFRTIHTAQVEQGTSEERLLDPQFWKMVAAQLRMNDRIEVYCEAGSFFAELMVRNVGTNLVGVQLLRFHQLDQARPSNNLNPDYEITWLGSYNKFGVVRRADKAIIRDKIATEELAYQELKDLTTALRR